MATQGSQSVKARRSLVRESIRGAGSRLDAQAKRDIERDLQRETQRRLGKLAASEDGQEYLREKAKRRRASMNAINEDLKRAERRAKERSERKEFGPRKSKLELQQNLSATASTKAAQIALTEATQDAGFETYATAKSSEKRIEWRARLGARASHSAMDGERVLAGEQFSNGLRFPGDPAGSAAESVNCRCTIVEVETD